MMHLEKSAKLQVSQSPGRECRTTALQHLYRLIVSSVRCNQLIVCAMRAGEAHCVGGM